MAHVGGLAQRTRIERHTLSHHLGFLGTAGLVCGELARTERVEVAEPVFSKQRGKERWYETAESRVRFQRQGDGQFSLTITARGSGVAVTLSVGVGSAGRSRNQE